MKKIVFFVAVAMFSILLTGCGHKTNIVPPSNSTHIHKLGGILS